MILSNVEIQKALDEKRLIIVPEPAPRTPDSENDCPYQTTSVDLRLGNEISWMKDDAPFSINLNRGKFAALFSQHSESCAITKEQPFELKPNKFVLAKTKERVSLPLDHAGPFLSARVEGRSSYARCGLLVHFTAPTIHAGFAGNITLEIINLGSVPILLYPDSYICQLIVETVEGAPFRNDSQFQGQAKAGGGP